MGLLDAYRGPWTKQEAAHLGRRAGFGRRPEELAKFVKLGMDEAVDSIVDFPIVDQKLEDEIQALEDLKTGSLKEPYFEWDLQNSWVYRMVHTRHPLQQQLQLFYHDHLVADWKKVWSTITDAEVKGEKGGTRGALNPWTQKIVRPYYDLLREGGIGPYRKMLKQMMREPAMLIYLDNRINTKEKPQENFARELMELFSMGVGNYSEEDIREIARAFTGEQLNERPEDKWPFTYEFKAENHDNGVKTVFGKKVHSKTPGAEGDQIVDLILDHVSGAPMSAAHGRVPATALYMSWKFLNWFVLESLPIDHPAVEELAVSFYETQAEGDNYNVRELLRKLFKSKLFYDAAHRQKMYKHPLDYMVMATRNLGLDKMSYETKWPVNKMGLPVWLQEMGMNLMGPPNVSGWTHGRTWINSGNLIARFNLANRMSSPKYMTDEFCDQLVTDGHVKNENDTDGIVEYLRERILQDELRTQEEAAIGAFMASVKEDGDEASAYHRRVRGCFHVMMTLPRYQTK